MNQPNQNLTPSWRRTWKIRLTPIVFFALLFQTLQSVNPAHTQQDTANGIPSTPVELTEEAINKRLQALDEQTDLKEETRKEIKSTYRDALNELNALSQLQTRISEYRNTRENASREIKQFQQKQEEIRTAPEISVPEQAPIDQLLEEVEKTGTYIPVEPELSFLEQQLKDRQSELESVRTTLEEVTKKLAEIKNRRENIQKLLNDTQETLNQVETEIKSMSGGDLGERDTAKLTALHARKEKLETRLKLLDLEKKTYEPRRDVLQARKNYLTARAGRLEKIAQLWQMIVSQNLERKAKEDLEETRETLNRVREAYPFVEELAQNVKDLAEERTEEDGPIKGLQQINERLKGAKSIRKSISSDLNNVKERIKAAGLTHRLGRLLRRKKNELPRVSDHQIDISELEGLLSEVQLRLIELNETKSRLIQEREERINQLLKKGSRNLPEKKRKDIREKLSDLMTRRLGLIEKLIEEYDRYFTKLTDLIAEKRKLVDLLKSYRTYINERVIWIQSTSNYFYRPSAEVKQTEERVQNCQMVSGLDANVREVPEALRCFTKTENWKSTLGVFLHDLRSAYLLYPAFLLLVMVMLWYRNTFFKRLREAGENTFSRFDDSFIKTGDALLYTLLLSVPAPILCLFLGWRFSSAATETSTFPGATGIAFTGVGLYLLSITVLRYTCYPEGLAENHFRWKSENTKMVRRNLLYFLYPSVPIVFLFLLMNHLENRIYRDSIGRTLFLITMLLVAWFIRQVLSPNSGILSDYLEEHRDGWIDRLKYVWYPLVIGVPLALAGLAIFGYYYTARQLMLRISLTFIVFLSLLYLVELFVRWQTHQNIQFAVKKQKERHEEQEEDEEETDDTSAEKTGDGQEPAQGSSFSLPSVNEQTRQLMWSFFWLGLGVGVWLIWADVLPALGMLNEIELWSHPMQVVETVTGEGGKTIQQTVEKRMPVTLADLLMALVTLVMMIIITKNLPGLLEITILQYLPMDQGLRYAYKTISRYLIVLLGIMLIAGSIGIRWGDVQWLAAAVSVGLGFGLQEIFANFVSGIIILFERPIRVGDTVTVNDVTGRVTRIRTRATTITDLDRKELIVPNRNFIQGELVNWTLSDSIMRVVIPIGVAYGSDTDLVEKKLMEITRREDIVLNDPEPNVIFTGFGDNALQFSLRFFIQDYENYWKAFHKINRAVDKEFREAGITIAFPQRDLHLKSVQDDISVSFSADQIPSEEEARDEPDQKE